MMRALYSDNTSAITATHDEELGLRINILPRITYIVREKKAAIKLLFLNYNRETNRVIILVMTCIVIMQ